MMGYSVGAGFNNTANTTIPAGRKCLELINDWTDEWELDTVNQSMALDGWASGNGFLNVVPDAEKLQGFYHIGMGTIKDILRSKDGEVQSYSQQTDIGIIDDIQADHIAHFKLWPINESAFGEGLGQVLARTGRGYQSSNGETVNRPSYFKMNEMFSDVNAKIFYSGQPRWAISPDSEQTLDEKTLTQTSSAFSKTDPLKHVTLPKKMKIDEIGLTSRASFDSLTQRYDKEFSAATKTPLLELISAMDFSYASSETALTTMLPLLGSFQRAYKRFIEKNLYEPFIIQAGKNPKIVDVQINWGAPKKLTVEDIMIVQTILNQPDLINNHSPKDIVDLLVEAGVPLPKTTTMIGQAKTETNFLNNLESVAGSKEKLMDLIIKEKQKHASLHKH